MFILKPKPLFFPHPFHVDHDGILAFEGSIDPSTLLMAYQWGIFPWSYSKGPYVWWFTHPRMVLIPSEVKISKSMRQLMRRERYHVSIDQAFSEVISQCQTIPRPGQNGTWLSHELKQSMIELHNRGFAHSVEVWEDDALVGGLYGLSLGKIFFGESMFAHKSNASKWAFITLCQYLEKRDYILIDCQQDTDHLRSLGAKIMQPGLFFDKIRENLQYPRRCFVEGTER